MTEAQAAAGMDRLPWLTDEAKPRPRSGGRDLLAWVVAAIVLVAGVAYWLGMNSAQAPDLVTGRATDAPASTSVPLPEPREAAPAPSLEPMPMPDVEPIVAPPMPVIDAPKAEPKAGPKRVAEKPARAKSARAAAKRKAPTRAKAKPARAKRKSSAPPVWPVRVVHGASGRLVRIGTFSTPRQAKRGWWGVMRAYPGMQRLPALVVPVRSLRDGRTYYRLQMGTTSQAHSEVLCQRMRMIGQSCVVIGVQRGGR